MSTRSMNNTAVTVPQVQTGKNTNLHFFEQRTCKICENKTSLINKYERSVGTEFFNIGDKFGGKSTVIAIVIKMFDGIRGR